MRISPMKTSLKVLSLLTITALAGVGMACAADATPAATPPATPPPQHGPGGQNFKERRLKHLDEALKLTDPQKQQITAIWAQAEQQGQALRSDEATAREQRRQKVMELMKATHDQVRGVLTPDQQKIFDSLPPEGRGHRGPRPGGKGGQTPPPPPAPPAQ